VWWWLGVNAEVNEAPSCSHRGLPFNRKKEASGGMRNEVEAARSRKTMEIRIWEGQERETQGSGAGAGRSTSCGAVKEGGQAGVQSAKGERYSDKN
jgi:diaminopimelate epimerase